MAPFSQRMSLSVGSASHGTMGNVSISRKRQERWCAELMDYVPLWKLTVRLCLTSIMLDHPIPGQNGSIVERDCAENLEWHKVCDIRNYGGAYGDVKVEYRTCSKEKCNGGTTMSSIFPSFVIIGGLYLMTHTWVYPQGSMKLRQARNKEHFWYRKKVILDCLNARPYHYSFMSH